MSRHISDRQSETGGGRLKHFLDVERLRRPEGSHPAAKVLHERPNARDGVARVRQYLRIERGWTA